MGPVTDYLPGVLLTGSLCLLGLAALEGSSIEMGQDTHRLCRNTGDVSQATWLELRFRNQHWIWVSCSEPTT